MFHLGECVVWTVVDVPCLCSLELFFFQSVIDANIFPVLIDILQKAEFRTRKEAAWAITNATSGGTPAQIRYIYQISALFILLFNIDAWVWQI